MDESSLIEYVLNVNIDIQGQTFNRIDLSLCEIYYKDMLQLIGFYRLEIIREKSIYWRNWQSIWRWLHPTQNYNPYTTVMDIL